MRPILALSIIALCSLFSATSVFATHIHFEDYGDADIAFDTLDEYTWTFDLEVDLMELWVLPDDYVQNQSYDFEVNPSEYEDSTGSMDVEDILHYAYLTIKFIDVNDGRMDSDYETVDLVLDLDTLWDEYAISQGGTGNIDVTSYLYDDHMLDVTITALSGSFTVDFLDLSGCYEDVAPVPEPATMLLFGSGLVGLAGFARKKSKKE